MSLIRMLTILANSPGLTTPTGLCPQYSADTAYLEFVQTSQGKGKVPHKTTPTSDSTQKSEVKGGCPPDHTKLWPTGHKLGGSHNSPQM